jgi:shikimate dehydrogenase
MAVFYFIGVTTAKSSIRQVFPLWMQELGHPEIELKGIDCKIHDSPIVYRRVVGSIKFDPNAVGALVTTHKIDLYAAAEDMFDYLDPYARLLRELSCISKNEGRLEGHAKDPISAGLSLDGIIGAGYFGRTGGEVLIFGAGGSSLATLLHLMDKPSPADRPARVTVVNRSRPRLDAMRELVEARGTDIEVVYVESQDPADNDRIMERLPDRSIVINATGMGKDTPGSPVTDRGLFPYGGIAWEFNYRGALDFLYQAEVQREARHLRVEDGWVYFLHGWTQVVAQALRVDLTPALFARLDALASTVRQ